jgi:hypothetical protein
MLFDLQGKRRRVVQATYLTLAILMGGGLVFFGIGSDVQGGLSDAFSGGGGGSDGNEVLEKRIERNEKKVAAAPANSEAARKALVRDYYQLAVAQTSEEGTFSADAKDDLRKAAENWRAYLKSEPQKVDTSLANTALQVFDPLALNKPKDAQEAARLIAEATEKSKAVEPGEKSNAYLRLVQYAALAGDTRTADLAAEKAVDLAPKSERKAVKAQAEQLKNPQAAGATPQQ